MSFPKADERKKCWAARDSYWQCLLDNQEDMSKCTAQRTDFEGSCTKQWLKYFDRKRNYQKFKEDRTEKEGFNLKEADG